MARRRLIISFSLSFDISQYCICLHTRPPSKIYLSAWVRWHLADFDTSADYLRISKILDMPYFFDFRAFPLRRRFL